MAEKPSVILSGFGDEAANQKTAEQQFVAFAALGLEYYSLRFIDVGNGVKNVMQLTKQEITKIRHLENEYELNVATIGSPIGKVKLKDVEDGTKNRFVPFKKYLADDVNRVCELAHAFETKLIRGFSFYHPRGTDPREHLPQVVDQLGQIAETCHRSDLTFGLEVEANLVGQTGDLMAEIHRQVNHPALVTIFDAANIITQGFSADDVFQQYLKMKKGLGWLHIKDYRHAEPLQRELMLLLEAEYEGRVTVVNPFGSVLTQNKHSMALMWERQELFSPQAQEWIQTYIPETRRFVAVDLATLHREEWVLKSVYGCEGDSVIVGHFTKPNDWQLALTTAIPRHWVAQRYFAIAPLENGLLPNVGAYLIGGEAAGFYTRLSSKSTDYTAVTAPTFVLA